MRSNAYFLAKFRFDTAENEPAKNLQKILLIFPNLLTLTPNRRTGDPPVLARGAGAGGQAARDRAPLRRVRRPGGLGAALCFF